MIYDAALWAQLIISKVDWINVVAGFIIGLTPVVSPIALRWIAYARSRDRSKYYGYYNLYHRSGTDFAVIRKKRLRLYKNIIGNDVVFGEIDPVTGLVYRGRFYLQHGVLYIVVSHSQSSDGIMMIFYAPIAGVFTSTSGVFSALNLKGKPTCWQAILSKNELDPSELSVLLQSDPISMERV